MSPDEMPAGYELDCLIAEKVMGRKLPIEYGIRYTDGKERWGQSPEYTVEKFNNYHRQGIAEALLQRPDLGDWSPSTHIAHAWEVVCKIHSTDRWADFCEALIDDGKDTDPLTNLLNKGHDAPLAICRAALKAVE